MANFLDVASELLFSHRVEKKRAEFERVLSAIGGLQQVHSKAQLDLNNIESIFTVLELAKTIRRVPGLESDEIEDTIEALKWVIVATLEATFRFPYIQNRIQATKDYRRFADLLRYLSHQAFPQQSASVISFNYDIGCDIALAARGFGPDYLLDGKSEKNVNAIPLMKLHGSLNWAKEKSSDGGTGRIHPVHLGVYLSRISAFGGDEVSLGVGSEIKSYFARFDKIDVEESPLIVPPSWNKSDYHATLSNIWAAAAQHLSEAKDIYVIGYSLAETDSFFRHLYALGSVGRSPLRRFFVYNPDESGATDERFRKLLGPGALARYKYHPQTFAAAIDNIERLYPGRSY